MGSSGPEVGLHRLGRRWAGQLVIPMNGPDGAQGKAAESKLEITSGNGEAEKALDETADMAEMRRFG